MVGDRSEKTVQFFTLLGAHSLKLPAGISRVADHSRQRNPYFSAVITSMGKKRKLFLAKSSVDNQLDELLWIPVNQSRKYLLGISGQRQGRVIKSNGFSCQDTNQQIRFYNSGMLCAVFSDRRIVYHVSH